MMRSVKLKTVRDALAQAPKPLYKNFFEALSGGVFGWSNRLKERIAVSEKTTVDIDGVWENSSCLCRAVFRNRRTVVAPVT